MQKLDLEANIRKDKTNRVRMSGSVPAIVYGKSMDPVCLEVDSKKITSVFSAGANQNVLITLKIKGEGKDKQTIQVLAHDVQKDPMKDTIMHVDFLKVNMEEEIKTKVSIVLVGEPTGVKLDGGILVHSLRQLEVKCLPGEIPDKISVDVSALKINESIHVSEIVLPKGVTILTSKEDAVAIVTSPTKEEEVAPVVEAAVTAEGAAVPAAGAPAAEGAAAPAADAKAKGAADVKADSKPAAKPSK